MKNKFLALLISLAVILLVGCVGKGEDASLEEFYDIMVEKQDFPDFEEIYNADEYHIVRYMGTQFWRAEPVQLWEDRRTADIYLFRLNGEIELLTKDLPDELLGSTYSMYLDEEECFYCNMSESIRKLDRQGTTLCSIDTSVSLPGRVNSLCQAPDGKMYMALSEVDGRKGLTLAELNPEDGSVTVLEEVETDTNGLQGGGMMYLGAGKAGPAVMGTLGIREMEQKTGELAEVLQLKGTSYSLVGSGGGLSYKKIVDFRVDGDGSVEVLRADILGGASFERLTLEKIQRTVVTICGSLVSDWIKRQSVKFNQQNETYHLKVEECWPDYDISAAEYEEALKDYAKRTSVQIATGKGPDILVGEEVLGDDIWDLVEKGMFENLAPYMAGTGLREEDYFPIAFNSMRRGDEIYSICPDPLIFVQEADGNILNSEPNIQELVDTLRALQEKAVYMEGVSAGELLRLFLEGSETLWGMVDWESESCDFGSGLFADLLEISEKYGDNSRNVYRSLVLKQRCFSFYEAATPSEREERGTALVGWMFDDGCHAVVDGTPIVINANSGEKEGAWEFLCFLLGEEAQKDLMFFPVNRNTFADWWTDNEFEQIKDYRHVYYSGINIVSGEWEDISTYGAENREFLENEKLPNFIQLLENARYLPVRTQPLLDIVCEEAEGYFSGAKSVEEVVSIIENRVKLYMSEHME